MKKIRRSTGRGIGRDSRALTEAPSCFFFAFLEATRLWAFVGDMTGVVTVVVVVVVVVVRVVVVVVVVVVVAVVIGWGDDACRRTEEGVVTTEIYIILRY